MLRFFKSLQSTTTISTSYQASSSTPTTPTTITKQNQRQRTLLEHGWSMPTIELMENLSIDDRFDRARECLLKYIYGDKWAVERRNCPETVTDFMTTTVLPEPMMITTVPFDRDIVTTFETTSFTIPAETKSLTLNWNAAFHNDGPNILLFLLSFETHFN